MSEISDALIAMCNGTKKVDFPKFPHDIYVRPLTVAKLIELQIKGEEESEEDYLKRFDIESNAYSLCDKNGEQIFSADEYAEFVDKCPVDIGIAILNAKSSLNDFESLDLDAKKK